MCADGIRFERLCSLCSWYTDADGGGYGDPAAAASTCAPGADLVADASDCDDADASTWPGVPEDMGGADRDCDGAPDPADTAGSTPQDSADTDDVGATPEEKATCGCSQGRVAECPAGQGLGLLALAGMLWSRRRRH